MSQIGTLARSTKTLLNIGGISVVALLILVYCALQVRVGIKLTPYIAHT